MSRGIRGQEKINLNELSQKEINQFARKLFKANMILCNVIHVAEELTNLHEFADFDVYSHKVYLNKLAKAYKKINKSDEKFAQLQYHESYFKDYDSFASKISSAIESIDNDND